MTDNLRLHTVYVVGSSESDARNRGPMFTDPDLAFEYATNTTFMSGEPPLRVYATVVRVTGLMTEIEL